MNEAKASLIDTLGAIQSVLVAPKGQTNTFGNYSYRSCEDILNALKPLLAEHGATVTLSDTIEEIGGRVYVHASATLRGNTDSIVVSAYAREPSERKGMDASQITGATSSYARKYALNGLFAIDDSKDADTLAPPKAAKKSAAKPISERVNAACKAYDDCTTDARLQKLDQHINDLIAECDDDQKERIEAARNAAIERAGRC